MIVYGIGAVLGLAVAAIAGVLAWCEIMVRRGRAEAFMLIVANPRTGEEHQYACRAKAYHPWPRATPWREHEVVYMPLWWWPFPTFFGTVLDRRPVVMYPGGSIAEHITGHALGHCEQWARDRVRMGHGYMRDLVFRGYGKHNQWEIGAEQFRRGCCTERDANDQLVRYLIDGLGAARLQQSRVWRVVDRRHELPEIRAKAAA